MVGDANDRNFHKGDLGLMRGKVELCGVNTSKLKVLKNEEMTELLRRVKQGDEEARQQMIEGNLRLVLSVIQRFSGRGESMDDLFQIGCIGLMKAVDNFDCEQYNVRFSTYGVPMSTPRREKEKKFMTIVQALEKAVDLIQFYDVENKNEIVEKLNLCKENIYTGRWTQEIVLDACCQLKCEKSSELTVCDFDGKRLPRPATIKNLFGMTPADFLDTYFERDKTHLHNHSKYAKMDQQNIRKQFCKEYMRVKPYSGEDFSRRYNNQKCPHWHTVCSKCGIRRNWTTLIQELKLPVFVHVRKPVPPKDDGVVLRTESRSDILDRWNDLQSRKDPDILKDKTIYE